jgi:4-hydroxy-3-methylbut-2-enyl diphosphate reductase
MIRKIVIARHHGFCMGVKRAINIAEETAQKETGQVTILKEIVHNEAVVRQFREKGVGQARSVDDVDSGTLIISAHGIAPEVLRRARGRGLNVVDATCPLVGRIYEIIEKIVASGHYVIHFGDPSHDETEGIVGHAPDRITVVSNREQLRSLPDFEDRKLGLTIQTTADMEQANEIKRLAREKWPHIVVFDTICNATSQRQSAIFDLAPLVDMVLVVGSESSANSNRLVKISEAICGSARLIDSADGIDADWFEGDPPVERIGITAGASTPQFLVEAVIKRLVELSGGKAVVVNQERRRKERRAGRATAG